MQKIASYPSVELEQAFHFHEKLRDVSEMIIKYLAVIALAYYRRDTRLPGKDNAPMEKLLQELRDPWSSLAIF